MPGFWMARYYFHIRDEGLFIEDDEGADYADLKAVHQEALLSARELISHAALMGNNIPTRTFEITDEQGRIVLTAPFAGAVVRGS